jgi:hypothetical protein
MKKSESEVLKIEESESELLCTDSTALLLYLYIYVYIYTYFCEISHHMFLLYFLLIVKIFLQAMFL